MTKTEKNRQLLGVRIKLARTKANLTQIDLAKKLGRTNASIAYLENGKRAVSTDLLTEISEATNQPITFFFENDSKSTKKTDTILNFGTQMEEIKSLLKKTQDQSQNLMDQSPDYVFLSRIDNFRFVAVNQRACDFYGYSKTEFLKMEIFDVEIQRPLKSEIRKLYDSTPVGKVIEVDGVNRKKDGTTFPVHVRFTKINDEYTIASVRDVSRFKKI